MACATAVAAKMGDEPRCASKIADIESLPGVPDTVLESASRWPIPSTTGEILI